MQVRDSMHKNVMRFFFFLKSKYFFKFILIAAGKEILLRYYDIQVILKQNV